jgi:hypothetical protein
MSFETSGTVIAKALRYIAEDFNLHQLHRHKLTPRKRTSSHRRPVVYNSLRAVNV